MNKRTCWWLICLWFGLIAGAWQMPLVVDNRLSLQGLHDFTPSLTAGWVYAAWLIGLFGLYTAVLHEIRVGRWHPRLPQLSAVTALLSLPLLWMYPYNANDIFRYALRGRITAVYGSNPFTQPPATFAAEPLLPLAGEWISATSPYGPVWELIAAGVAAIAGDSLGHIFLLKGTAVVAHLLVGAGIWMTAVDNRPWVTAAWLLNPAALLLFAGDGHNDGWMLVWLVWGWWLADRHRSGRVEMGSAVAGFLVMCLSPLTKMIGALALPFAWLALLRRLPARRRWMFAAVTGGGALGLVGLTFAPFGSPAALATRLMSEAGDQAGFSWAAWGALSQIRAGQTPAVGLMGRIHLLLVMGTAGWWAWRTWQDGRSPVRTTADILGVYVFTALNFRLWYALWLLPFALLADGRRGWRTQAALAFLITSQLSVVVYTHLWRYQFAHNHFYTHLWGVPFTFGVPLLWAAGYRLVRMERR